MDPREREGIELGLASSDDELRRLAVEQLGGLPAGDAVPLLLRCLGDESWRVRKAAVERLVAAPEAWRAAHSLIEALADDSNAGRRNAAVETLVRFGKRAVPALLDAASHSDADVRKLVVEALAGIGDERATPRLIDALGDPDPNVRGAVADGLGALGGSEVERRLLQAAADANEDRLVRFSALRALARLEAVTPVADLEPLLADSWLRPMAFTVLGNAEDEGALEPLLKGLAHPSRPTREAAMEALLRWVGRLDGSEAERLAERVREVADASPSLVTDAMHRLRGAEFATRLVLVQFLGLLRWSEAVEPLLEAAHDEALAEVVLASLVALGESAEQAIERCWRSIDARSRQLACDALGRTHGELGKVRLLAAADDPEPEVRCHAAKALGRRGAIAAIPSLVARLVESAELDDPDAEDEIAAMSSAIVELTRPGGFLAQEAATRTVTLLGEHLPAAGEATRFAIAGVIGRIGRPEDASLLASLLSDPSPRVRRATVDALAELGACQEQEHLRLALADESPMVRIAAAGALGSCGGPDAPEALGQLARDTDLWVRAAALRAIGTYAARHPERLAEALSMLEPTLQDAAPVAMAAVDALRETGGDSAARAASAVLGRPEPEIVQAAVRCIGQHGDAGALESLLPLVAHGHWSVRAETIQTLAERRTVRAVPTILRRLEVEQDDFVRAAILRALHRLEA